MAVTSPQRPDPVALLLDQEAERLPWLLPERHRRMAESAFAYYRGAAAVNSRSRPKLSASPVKRT